MSQRLDDFWRAVADRYAPERPIGSGRGATVWRARDLRHGREVALKLLSPELTAFLGVQRFLKEIEVTAALQHAHIVPLFDSGEVEGLLYYVMPYVRGETLRARLTRERLLPVEDAVRMSVEVASALAHAHGEGVVHRDIKPENILLHDGRALVADFGIVLASGTSGEDRITQVGFSPGTPHYMSPEQASGEQVLDGRSDLYSLACVTYEMLAGRPPFVASAAHTVVSKVLAEAPDPVGVHRKTVPSHVEWAIDVALEKLPADRFRSVAEYAEALQGVDLPGLRRSRRARRGIRHRRGIALAGAAVAAGLVFGAGVTYGIGRSRLPAAPVTRLVVRTPVPISGPGDRPVALSPDGRCLAYTADRRLYVQCFDSFEPTEVPLAEAAYNPVFSPDGQWVAFQNEVFDAFKVPLAGGPPVKICDCGWAGADWGTDGTIVYSRWGTGGLMALSADGGTPWRLTTADRAAGEINHLWPHILPDGRVAFTVERVDGARLAVTDAQGGRWREIHPEGVLIGYSPSGHLVYGWENRVWALPFDVHHGEPTGDPFPVFDLPLQVGHLPIGISKTGTLAYTDRPLSIRQELVLLDPQGQATILSEGDGFQRPRASPDGSLVAYSTGPGEDMDLWVYDHGRGTRTRLTRQGSNIAPVWSPDGREIFFSHRPPGPGSVYGLFRVRADGGREPELVAASSRSWYAHSWSADGRRLAIYDEDPERTDVLVLDLESDGKPVLVAGGGGDQFAPALSPDGRFVAYASEESGRPEIYVVSLEDEDRKWTVSSGGGEDPVWAHDGRSLYFLSGKHIMRAAFWSRSDSAPGRSERLLEIPFPMANLGGRGREYDLLPDGRFLFARSAGNGPDAVNVVLGWDRQVERMATER